MKSNLVKTLIAIMLVVTCLFTLIACGGLFDFIKDTGGDKDNDQTQTDGNDNGGKAIESVSFDEDSWATISQISESGDAREYYEIGDEKTIELLTGEEVTFQIIGFAHDDLADGSGKAGMTLGMKNLLMQKYRMNDTATNSGGFRQTEMRNVTLPEIFTQLPVDLQAFIKLVNKVSSVGDDKKTEIFEEKLFLFSSSELDGNDVYAVEGVRYEFHKTSSKKKYLNNGNGDVSSWYMRTTTPIGFRIKTNAGGVTSEDDPTKALGICFGFCV